MFAVLAGVSMLAVQLIPTGALAANYSQELTDAYNWAYSKGVTTMSPIDNANMYGAITRSEMAKMLSVYATEVLGMTPNTAAACTFSDIASVKGDLHDYIIESCQLGIMGQGISAFRPYDTISRAEFGTALSRVLWGSQYEGGTPYYAKHLDALKAAGIMTQIANAESTKEVRGYVMLMLMRSEGSDAVVDCDDPMTVIACTTDTEACPAKCRESGNDTPSVVKSGELEITANATSNRKAIIGGVSDLDTLKFRTSEDVTITKVTLERYGYSKGADVVNVRLEDEDGNQVTEPKSLGSKDQVTLSLKKDYRVVDGNFNATIVVELADEVTENWSIGFKVVDVVSTAEDVDLDDYTPYEYDMVGYEAVSATIDHKGTAKDYNYEEGESYEVAKFKVKASTSPILVKGFTLTNVGDLDLADFLDKVEVLANGTAVKWVKASMNKEDQLVISFNDYELAAKESVTFSVNVSFEDFDEYGAEVKLWLAKSTDFNAVEKKTGARISFEEMPAVADWAAHKFNGSKIKLENTKLGNVESAAGSTDIVVAEGKITVAEPIKIASYVVTGTYSKEFSGAIEEMRLVVAGEEYDATVERVSATVSTFTFKNIEIEESGKLQILVDLDEDALLSGTVITFAPTINKSVISGAKYTDTKKYVSSSDVAGSISFASKLTVQASKASLENDLTKTVEFVLQQTSRKVVFDGTYTAKKGDVYLNTVVISGDTALADNDVTFYVSIDGQEVTSVEPGEEDTFSDVLVKAGKSVKVKIEAEVEAYGAVDQLDYTVKVWGEDADWNEAGNASDSLVTMKVRESGSTTVSATASKNTLLLKAKNQNIAEFTVKPSNSNDTDLDLDEITLKVTLTSIDCEEQENEWTPASCLINDVESVATYGTKELCEAEAVDEVTAVWADEVPASSTLVCDDTPTDSYLDADAIRLKIDGTEYDGEFDADSGTITYQINEWLGAGVTAVVTLKAQQAGSVVVDLVSVNGKNPNKSFSKMFADALVYLTSQTDEGDYTQYKLGVEKYDDSYEISALTFYANTGCTATLVTDGLSNNIADGDEFTINNGTTTQTIRCMAYQVSGEDIEDGFVRINNVDYADYFKVNGTARRVFSNNN